MMKQITSILIALCLIVSLVPTTIFADDTVDYGFQINGQNVTSENINKLSGVKGNISYNQSTKTLTLNNTTITIPGTSRNVKAIHCQSGITAINLVGKNEIKFESQPEDAYYVYGIYSSDGLTISGKSRQDSLKITATQMPHFTYGIYLKSYLNVKKCTFDVFSSKIGNYDYAIAIKTCKDINIDDCNFTAVVGMNRDGTIPDESRVFDAVNSIGEYGESSNTVGDITISNSTVTAGAYTKTNVANFATLNGKNITLTNCKLSLDAKLKTKNESGTTGGSVRVLHTGDVSDGGKIKLTDCTGTINSVNGSNGKGYGIDIWKNVPEECLLIDRCSLTIEATINAVLIEGDDDVKKQPIFKNISKYEYGTDDENTEIKTSKETKSDGYWRNHYFKITAAAKNVELSKNSLSMIRSEREKITATITPDYAEQNVIWTSSDNSVAKVNNGTVTALKGGTATITATADDGSGVKSTCKVTVSEPVYNVTLNTYGGTIANNKNVTKYTYTIGATLPTSEDITYNGYAFGGWYSNNGFTGSPVTKISTTDSGNKTFYAKWTTIVYDINYNLNDGTATNPTTYDVEREDIKLNNPKKNGYIFTGWSGTDLTGDNNMNVTIPKGSFGNRNYTAHYSEKSDYTITLDTSGGKDMADITGVKWTDKLLDFVGTPVKTGYTFNGWMWHDINITENTTYAELVGYDNVMSVQLTASWTEKSNYTIKFDANGGMPINDQTGVYWTGRVLQNPPYTEKDGWEIDGWKCGDTVVTDTTTYADLANQDTVMSITLTAQWKDVTKPTGKITVGKSSWTNFMDNVDFGFSFNETQTIEITAEDNSGESVKIEYLISDVSLTENELNGKTFEMYNAPFNIDKDGEYIVYVKFTDTTGNISYICSGGFVIDTIKPVIKGIENGKTYCSEQTVTVSDKYLVFVRVNGKGVSLKNNQFVLSPSNESQTIVVTDMADNVTTVTVTVNNGHTAEQDDGNCMTEVKCAICGEVVIEAKTSHTFGEWKSNGNGTHTRKCTASGCNKGTETENCSGGKATCNSKAKCEVCGESYGKINKNNHSDLKHFAAKSATKKSKGNIEYWYCKGCNKYFSNKKATKEISKSDTVIEKLKDTNRNTQKDTQKSPQTGDNSNILLLLALLLFSGDVLVTLAIKIKKNRS